MTHHDTHQIIGLLIAILFMIQAIYTHFTGMKTLASILCALGAITSAVAIVS